MARQTLRVLSSLAALLLALFVLGVAPAMAAGKGDKGGKSAGSGYTEDNDTNDDNTPNNVSDDGDNAHPSGKDRSVENGGSGTQGKSQSDPDGDSNGGPDKANGSGGVDMADQDGNNGCGNDDDFEDDNNGNCGPKDKTKVKADSCTKTTGKGKAVGHDKKCDEVLSDEIPCTETMPSGTTVCGDDVEGDEVKDGSISKPCVEDATMGADESAECDDATTEDDVLGSILRNEGSDSEGAEVMGDTITNEDDVAPAAAAEREAGAALPFTGAQILSILALGGGLIGSGYLFVRRDRS